MKGISNRRDRGDGGRWTGRAQRVLLWVALLVAALVTGLAPGPLAVASARAEPADLPVAVSPAEAATAVEGLESITPKPSPPPAPTVPFDKLFELPSSFEPQKAQRRGGEGETEWRKRFSLARDNLEYSELSLAKAKLELSELAESSGGWGVAPPVPGMQAQNNDAPMNYELSQRIKKAQESVDSARRQMVNLEVEANLADVPEGWRR